MPTGYTAKLCDGKKQTFAEFALTCARAFGALVTMRDEGLEVPIPKKFEPSPYHSEQIAKAHERLGIAERMSAAEAEKAARVEYEVALADYTKARQENDAKRGRLRAMRHEAEEWAPPTPDHAGLKKFMLEQLDTTIKFDCNDDYPTRPVLKTGEEKRRSEVEKALADIAYHDAELAKERQRCAERTEWVRALRASLEPRK